MKFDDVAFFSVCSRRTPRFLNALLESSRKTALIDVKRSLVKHQEVTRIIEEREATSAFSMVFVGILQFLCQIFQVWKEISSKPISDSESAPKPAPVPLFFAKIWETSFFVEKSLRGTTATVIKTGYQTVAQRLRWIFSPGPCKNVQIVLTKISR